MKTGIITFHWATNYGAVLQAYALQYFLSHEQGFDVEIINYIPRRVKFKQAISTVRKRRFKDFVKEYKLKKFRKNNFLVSQRKYSSSEMLIDTNQYYDVFICGSDQIWNEWFLHKSERRINPSYFLHFVDAGKTRISYATSFGTDELSKNTIEAITPELEKYKSIFVREKSGEAIINRMGFDVSLVVDPTLLLRKETYENIIEQEKKHRLFDFFPYILHNNQSDACKISEYIYENHFDSKKDRKYMDESISVNEWLYSIKNTRFVLTNSYHGVIFSVLFHRPFIVVLVQNSHMNNRVITLLQLLGLEDRIVHFFEPKTVDALLKCEIDWKMVQTTLDQLRKESAEKLLNSL